MSVIFISLKTYSYNNQTCFFFKLFAQEHNHFSRRVFGAGGEDVRFRQFTRSFSENNYIKFLYAPAAKLPVPTNKRQGCPEVDLDSLEQRKISCFCLTAISKAPPRALPQAFGINLLTNNFFLMTSIRKFTQAENKVETNRFNYLQKYYK
jgi:hypothetical protein